jgi:hypothetical protein
MSPTCKHQLNIQRRIFLAVFVVVVPASCPLLCASCIAQCECCTERLAQGACLEASQRTGIAGWRLQISCLKLAGCFQAGGGQCEIAIHGGASDNVGT